MRKFTKEEAKELDDALFVLAKYNSEIDHAPISLGSPVKLMTISLLVYVDENYNFNHITSEDFS